MNERSETIKQFVRWLTDDTHRVYRFREQLDAAWKAKLTPPALYSEAAQENAAKFVRQWLCSMVTQYEEKHHNGSVSASA